MSFAERAAALAALTDSTPRSVTETNALFLRSGLRFSAVPNLPSPVTIPPIPQPLYPGDLTCLLAPCGFSLSILPYFTHPMLLDASLSLHAAPLPSAGKVFLHSIASFDEVYLLLNSTLPEFDVLIIEGFHNLFDVASERPLVTQFVHELKWFCITRHLLALLTLPAAPPWFPSLFASCQKVDNS